MTRLRAWLKSDMRTLRWVFLSLYAALLLVPVLAATFNGYPLLILLGIMLGCQALFIFGSGTIQLCQPMRKRRLIFPVIVAAFMMALLTLALILATGELIQYDGPSGEWMPWAFLAFGILVWAAWGWIFWRRYHDAPRQHVMARLSAWILAGSLLELLACVPMHLIVSRRPGCLVGLFTMLGIISGCLVACFAFGPAIVLLFLRPRHREELAAAADGARHCDVCGYDLRASTARCPECGTPFGEPKPPSPVASA
jgi:hypothetical protein